MPAARVALGRLAEIVTAQPQWQEAERAQQEAAKAMRKALGYGWLDDGG